MRRTSRVAGLVVAGVCVAGPAFAVDATEVSRRLSYSEQDVQAGLDVGIGLGGFTGDLGDETGVGGLFNITANAQPYKYIGVEAGYEGQNIPIDDARVAGGNHIWRNNGTLLGKLGPIVDQKWHPFVGAGLGLSYLHASSGSQDVYNNDWQTELPLAAGIEYRLGALTAGVRATYRLVGGEELVERPGTNDDAKGSLFNGNITVGGRF
ncbi:outer membrane beta-barrel protein [Corallococcus macrosporus]|uniref:Outer membrane beta-barrel protein n=1 Tax=Corallococcus macrosporus TaxID=35 RepID=A0ABS3D3G5_9BACT|nr:outer membrane beta-barrel protein [Corallococcus macrosporus]MBN8226183.1 outer membrane beta-barrel protein [Corallococcus macrosporus]